MRRCPWNDRNEKMILYHDTEWGVPVHEDQKLFEFLSLDCFQAGISWEIVLNKRDAFREAFDQFDITSVASFDETRMTRLMENSSIVRNRRKIYATVNNARAILKVQQEFGSLDRYLWQFTEGKTLVNAWKTLQEIPPVSDESEKMSRDLKKRGFQFVGPTICYAVMQSIGMVNDHLVDCFRYSELLHLNPGG